MTTSTAPSPARRRSVVHRLLVSEVQALTDDAVAITFDVPPELREEYRFAAGQHVNVSVPGGDGIRRSYSICSSAGSAQLRIAVKRIAGGQFSALALDGLATGDELDVMTPAGRFGPQLDPARARHYGAVAAGSGITPVLSIIATVLEEEPHSKVTLVYGNRTASSVMFVDELGDLKDRFPQRFQLVHVLSREPGSSELLSGRLDAGRLDRLFATVVAAETVDEWYLCGPMPMIESAVELLARRGVDRSRVHRELYHVGEAPPEPRAPEQRPAAQVCQIVAELDGRRSETVLDDPDGVVLDAVLAVRNDAPFACKGGVCGTCRAKVLDGAVDMERTYALEDDEIEAGYVLTCQSHPTTPTLHIDYDA